MGINYQGQGGGVPRATAKIFAENALTDDVTVFGSTLAGSTVKSKDITQIQNADFEAGWRNAVISNKNYPLLADMNGILLAISQQVAYMLQHGLGQYDANTEYYTYDLVNQNGIIYISTQDNNTGNVPSNNSSYWAVYYDPGKRDPSRNLGEIVQSTVPLTDASLHLLDGALLNGGGSYGAFVNYISGLVSDYPDLFTTESTWQSTVTTYGVCGKFVYDSVNNTVRLPKITGILEGTTDVNALGDLVEAGLPNITGHYNGYELSDSPYSYSGALYPVAGAFPPARGEGSAYGIGFNAAYSNAIYGASDTVQPQTIKTLYYIVVATTTKTAIEVDIDDIATDLNGKADTDLSNTTSKLSDSFLNKISPDYLNAIDTTITVSGQEYTYICPSSGVVTPVGIISNDNASGYLKINDVNVGWTYNAGNGTYNGTFTGEWIVAKGDVVKVQTAYVAPNAAVYLRFFPMKGAN